MKASTTSFFSLVIVLVTIAGFSSCSKTDRLSGAWMGEPQRIILPSTADATSTVTLDFAPFDKKAGSGNVALSAVVSIVEPMSGLEGFAMQFQADIAATASVEAKYVYEKDEDDEIILVFDPSSLKVNVDPSGVTLSQDVISDIERPTLDSLTTTAAEHWRIALTPVLREFFHEYSRIDDIDFHHNDVMTIEVDHRKETFHRIGVPD